MVSQILDLKLFSTMKISGIKLCSDVECQIDDFYILGCKERH